MGRKGLSRMASGGRYLVGDMYGMGVWWRGVGDYKLKDKIAKSLKKSWTKK